MICSFFYAWLNGCSEVQVSNDEAKLLEISKLQKAVESLTLELDAAKLATLNEFNKNTVLERKIELSAKEKSAFEREVISMTELRNENALLKVFTSCLSFDICLSMPVYFCLYLY